ncbi:MAG: hypothetical protein JWS10_317 [Cypionkella sp.]|nr:hypothetical protein [Cypionkella sp.]
MITGFLYSWVQFGEMKDAAADLSASRIFDRKNRLIIARAPHLPRRLRLARPYSAAVAVGLFTCVVQLA